MNTVNIIQEKRLKNLKLLADTGIITQGFYSDVCFLIKKAEKMAAMEKGINRLKERVTADEINLSKESITKELEQLESIFQNMPILANTNVFQAGDRVQHATRGTGTFVAYGLTEHEAVVRFDKYNKALTVTADMLTKEAC